MSTSVLLEVHSDTKLIHSPKSPALRKKLRALDTLLEGDAGEQRETFKHLKRALNAERASHRKLFS